VANRFLGIGSGESLVLNKNEVVTFQRGALIEFSQDTNVMIDNSAELVRMTGEKREEISGEEGSRVKLT
jgi:hypothetical protein